MSDQADIEGAGAGFESVHVELDWYDGPRLGLANVHGLPHYFRAAQDYVHGDDQNHEYLVWPANETVLAWERELWASFIDWYVRVEAGTASVDSHPGNEGVDLRYDELCAAGTVPDCS